MHYYKKNIGDYQKKAGRLSMLQHGAYSQLIDSCYDREIFPTLEEALDWTWASSKEEVESVEFVLKKFFKLQEDGRYQQKRIKEELETYHKNSETNKRIAIERETKRKDKRTVRKQLVNEPPPNQEPRTTNQEPLVNIEAKASSSNLTDSPPPRDPVPYQKIIELYHLHLPMCPRVIQITDKRKASLRARWKNGSSNLDFWGEYFKHASTSNFLTGKVAPTMGRKQFITDIDFLIRPDTAVKMQEGKYHG